MELICVVVMALSIMIGGHFWFSVIMGIVWFLDIVEPSYHRMPMVRVGISILAWENIFGFIFTVIWYVIHAMGHYQIRSVERLKRELANSPTGKMRVRRDIPLIGIPRLFSYVEIDKNAKVFRKTSIFGSSDPQKWKRVEDAEFPNASKIWGCGRIEFDSKKVHKDNEVKISGIPHPVIVILDEQYEATI